MAYYGGWILLVVLSIWAALIAFVWAVRSGQFSQQGRARFLPLIDAVPGQPSSQESLPSSRGGYALLFILGLGAAGMLCAVILSLYHL